MHLNVHLLSAESIQWFLAPGEAGASADRPVYLPKSTIRSSGTEPADDRGTPVSCPVDQLRPHLVMSRAEARKVVRSPGNLRLHRALGELDLIDVLEELNEAARLNAQSASAPILITMNGTILAGFGRWPLALLEGRHEVYCIEYPISEEESLQFILNRHKPRRGWNAFVRIRLALTLEPDLQQRALDNMRAGGKCKGLANLPEAQRMDVRQQIADAAGLVLVTSAT